MLLVDAMQLKINKSSIINTVFNFQCDPDDGYSCRYTEVLVKVTKSTSSLERIKDGILSIYFVLEDRDVFCAMKMKKFM